MDLDEFFERDPLFLGIQVEDLAGNEATATGGAGKLGDKIGPGVPAVGSGAGHRSKRLREKPVPGQDGHGFAVDLVVGRAPATKIIVVHAGQVVMDQGIGVDAFHRAGGRQGRGFQPSRGPGRGKTENGTKAFSTGEETVAHCLVDESRMAVPGNQAIQRLFDHG